MPERPLNKELQRARFLVDTRGFKPFLPNISLQVRRELADIFSTEECLDRLCTITQLHRPLADEVPLWEEYSELAKWLDKMDVEEQEADEVVFRYQNECLQQLQEAENDFEKFLTRGGTCAEDVQEAKIARRTMSKDDILVGRANHEQNELRRRPSFMADTSQGIIEVEPLETTCVKKTNLPVTSTPHVPHRKGALRVSISNVAVELFTAETAPGRPRAPSLSRIDYDRERTIDIKGSEDENEAADPRSTTVVTAKHEPIIQGDKTIIKKGNATIVKSSPDDAQPKNPVRVPRIANGRGRPPVAPRIVKEPQISGVNKFSSKIQILPSKTASGPSARTALPRKPILPSKEPNKETKSTSSSSTRTTSTGIARPSKPGRLPVRK